MGRRQQLNKWVGSLGKWQETKVLLKYDTEKKKHQGRVINLCKIYKELLEAVRTRLQPLWRAIWQHLNKAVLTLRSSKFHLLVSPWGSTHICARGDMVKSRHFGLICNSEKRKDLSVGTGRDKTEHGYLAKGM